MAQKIGPNKYYIAHPVGWFVQEARQFKPFAGAILRDFPTDEPVADCIDQNGYLGGNPFATFPHTATDCSVLVQ